jgi:hypothetical protein
MKKLLCLAVLACGVFSAAALDLVKDGAPQAVIVIPDTPSLFVKRAADELRYFVERASGAELAIWGRSVAAGSDLPKVYIDKPEGFDIDSLNTHGFYIRNVGDDLVITGKGNQGAEFGVYHFIDAVMGVRWVWPGPLGEVVPKQKTISANTLDITFRQPIQSSRIHPSFAGEAGWQSREAWAAFVAADYRWLDRMGFSWDGTYRSQHSFGHPGWQYEKYLKTHPEYFNLLPDGTRRPNPYHVGGAENFTCSCPSSDGLLEQCLKDWREKGPQGYPFGPSLYVGENDTPGSCCCPTCLASDERNDPDRLARARARFAKGDRSWPTELGCLSERYAKFFMKALTAAKKFDPPARVVGQAYANYQEPPKTKLDKDVIICFTDSLMYPWTQPKIDDFKRRWKGWHDAGATMVLRPNFMLDGHCMPVNFARKFYDIYAFCLANGLAGTEYDSDIGQFGANGFNYYVMARTTMRPDLTFDQIQDEYCSAFGKAAAEIRACLAYWEEVSDSRRTTDVDGTAVYNPVGAEAGSWNYFYLSAPLIYTPDVMAKGKAFLDQAEARVTDDPEALARVRFLQKGLRNAELTCEAQRAFATRDKYKTAAAVARLDEFRAEIEPEFVANMNFLNQWENAAWDRTALRFLMKAPGDEFRSPWKFAFDPENKGVLGNWAADGLDDSGWDNIGVDSGWELQEPGRTWKAEHGEDYDGYAWYRNTFTLAPKDKGGQCVITFGACDESCTIYVNGTQVLERPYPCAGDSNSWSTPFTVDATAAVRWDRPNSIAIHVHDSAMQGGLWKPVWYKTLPAPNGTPNLIADGSFEAGGKWGEHNASGKTAARRVADQARSGTFAGQLEVTELNRTGRNLFEYGWVRYYQSVNVEPGKTYSFSAHFRTEPGYNGSVRFWVYGEGVRQEAVVGDTGGLWQAVTFPAIKTTDKTGEVIVYLNILGDLGKVWFDDVELREE